MDLMCLAHDSTPYGQCMPDMSEDSIKMTAKVLSLSRRTFVNHLQGLLQMRRVLQQPDGSLIIKRMVEEEAYSRKQSALGHKGGNPSLMARDKPERIREENTKREESQSDENFSKLLGSPHFQAVTYEQWRKVVRSYPNADASKVVDELIMAADMDSRGVNNPGSMVLAFFRNADKPSGVAGGQTKSQQRKAKMREDAQTARLT